MLSRVKEVGIESGLKPPQAAYKTDAARYRARTGKDLSVANFSKAQEYVGKLLDRPLPQSFRGLASS